VSKVVLILTATSVALGALSVHLVKQMRDGQASIAELQAQVATLEQQQQQQRQQQPPAPAVASLPPPPPEAVPPTNVTTQQPGKETWKPAPVSGAASPPAFSREDRIRMIREGRDRQRQLMQDPEYRAALRLQNRNSFVRSYPGVAEDLGLDARQTDEFFALLSDQQMRASDSLEPMWDMEGKDPSSMQEQQRKVQQRAAELQRQSEAEIAAKFGADKLQQWKEYQSTLGARHQTEQMRATLAGQGMPVSDEASKSMIKAMAEVQKAEASEQVATALTAMRGGPAAPRLGFSNGADITEEAVERQIEATKKRNQRTLDAISPFLTYEQRQVVENDQEAQLKLQQAHMRIMRSQGNANSVFVTGGSASAQGVLVPTQ